MARFGREAFSPRIVGERLATSRFVWDGDMFVRFGADTSAFSPASSLSPVSTEFVHSPALFAKGTTASITAATAFPADGIGDGRPPAGGALIVVKPDEAGNGKGVAPGNPVLTVDAAHTYGTINVNGDEDYYQVQLVAGQTYEIGMYGYAGATPAGTPLPDSYIQVYGADGTTLIVEADGGAHTAANDVNSGMDVLLTFTPETSGTYYINARAFDNSPLDGTTGEGVGDYELFVRHQDPNDPNAYRPYYDVDNPLYAIDWGTQVDGTARNPDGNEGIRPTGNPQGTPVQDQFSVDGKNVIKIYFAKAGDVYTSNDPTNPGLPPAIVAVGAKDFEITAVMTALGEFSKVADVVYVITENRDEANFHYVTYSGTPGPGISLLGSMSPPQESDEGLAQFNSGDYRWSATNLQQGGFSFVTLIHEFGHGHGLAHPHDTGGHSGVMHGVEPEGIHVQGQTIPDPVGVWPDYTMGDYNLNQGVFTMMSYEDGWQTSPYGNAPTDVGYGYLGGLMAFDIAAIQDKYGVNEDYAKGNDTYVLKDVNAAGTYYTSIWDTGGIDQMVYDGSRNANIDLRAATLQYEEGGGGWVSYAYGIYGGFTIANKVVIENAHTGSGNDRITGNDVDNVLSAGAGDDELYGNGGNDTLDGGTGFDKLSGGKGNDTYYGDNGDIVTELADEGYDSVYTRNGITLAAASAVEFIGTTDSAGTAGFAMTGSDYAQTIVANAGNNELHGGGGDDYLRGLAGGDNIDGGAGADVMEGGIGDDIYFVDNAGDVIWENDGEGNDWIYTSTSYALGIGAAVENIGTTAALGTDAINLSGSNRDNTIVGNDGVNVLNGGGGNDYLRGLGGNDVINGGAGQDIMEGGAGADTFVFEFASDSSMARPDSIWDFTAGVDRIDLSLVDANSTIGGDQAFTFIGSNAFSGKAGELRVEMVGATAHIVGDTNGDGIGDLYIVAYNTPQPVTNTDFVL